MSWKWFLPLILFLFGGCATTDGRPVSDQVPRMSIKDLKARLGSPDLVVLDVRQPGDWSAGNTMIAGAIREDPREFSRWHDKYPKEKTLVLYCA